MIWTPAAPAFDRAGVVMSATNTIETGAVDPEF